MKNYFTIEEIMNDIIDFLDNLGDKEYFVHELPYEIFITKNYINNVEEAIQALEQYGLNYAISKVRDYELYNFGEVFTDLNNCLELANKLYIAVGDDFIKCELQNIWGELVDDEVKYLIIDKLKNIK